MCIYKPYLLIRGDSRLSGLMQWLRPRKISSLAWFAESVQEELWDKKGQIVYLEAFAWYIGVYVATRYVSISQVQRLRGVIVSWHRILASAVWMPPSDPKSSQMSIEIFHRCMCMVRKLVMVLHAPCVLI